MDLRAQISKLDLLPAPPSLQYLAIESGVAGGLTLGSPHMTSLKQLWISADLAAEQPSQPLAQFESLERLDLLLPWTRRPEDYIVLPHDMFVGLAQLQKLLVSGVANRLPAMTNLTSLTWLYMSNANISLWPSLCEFSPLESVDGTALPSSPPSTSGTCPVV
eukprot:TRINITY_DN12192_c0_g1_i11.p2 TRINITY_DN12192_c0_g1~~TRINITY_DN12192_c0_g1_i11.p2  ORF type:complete len:162 (+),score=5.55 TRINITY_DN12192_c0_g1_i11:1582-2067(+)